jgi:hypothetical protein
VAPCGRHDTSGIQSCPSPHPVDSKPRISHISSFYHRPGPPFVGSWEGFNGGGATAANTTTLPRTGAQALTLSITSTLNTFAGAFP